MSTKTTFKRIALVAVASMGFGVLTSVAPASAANTITALSSAAPSVERAGTGNTVDIVVTNTTAQVATANDAYTAKVLSVPATATNNTAEVGDFFQTAALGALADADETTLTLGAANRVEIDGTALADAGIAAALADGDAVTVADAYRVSVAATPANINTGDVVEGGYDANGDGDYADAADIAPTGASDDFFNVAGTYTVGVWYDFDADTILDASEVATYHIATIVAGGTPASVSVTPTVTSMGAGIKVGLKVYVTDSGSRPTTLINSETVYLQKSVLTGAGTVTFYDYDDPLDDPDAGVLTDITNAAIVEFGAAAAVQTDTTYYQVDAANSAGGTWKVTANMAGTLTPLATAATTGTLTSNAVSDATKLAIATTGLTTNQYKLVGLSTLSATGSTSDTVFASAVTHRSIAFTVTGTPATYVNVTLSAVTDGSDSLTAGTTAVLIGSDGTGTYTVAPDSVSATTAYTVTVPRDGGTLAFTLDFMAPTVDCAGGGCSITSTGLPTGVSKDVKTKGQLTSFDVTVKDQFGTAYSNYVVKLTSGTTARNASLAVTAITGADGKATVSYTDASTSTTVLTDAVTISVYAPSNLLTNIFDVGNTITLDYTGVLGSLTLSGGSTSTTTVKREVVNATVLDDAAAVTADAIAIDNILLSSASAAVTGYATTYTGTAGLLFIADSDNDGDVNNEGTVTGLGTIADGLATVTVPNDTQVFVLSTKSGVGTITVTAGGLTKTINVTFTTKADAASARNVAISAPTSGTSGVYSNVAATVTDGHGNTIEGATVTFIRTGGRFATGASSVNVTTDANGVAAIDVTTETAATVTVAASLPVGTYAEADDIAATPVSAFAAASGAKSASIAFTGTATDAIAAATAAAAKAGADATAAAAKAGADAVAAAAKAGADAVAAANAASAAAVAASQAASAAAVEAASAAADAATEATDAANAATDAANASAEAGDAATAAAQDAADAVAALSTQVSEMISALKAQLTALTNLVIKIQKKVKA